MPQCPHCGCTLHEIDYVEKGQIEFDGNITEGWAFMQDAERTYQCQECHTILDTEDLEKLGVPEEMR
jgi:hypothetical protein